MLVAFSTQDQQKLQIVAGSMREAFGVQTETRYSGIIEVDGMPTRTKLKNVTSRPQDNSVKTEDRDDLRKYGTSAEEDRSFALASASLRQAMQEPARDHRPLQAQSSSRRPRTGLNIEIVDQDGRSMFPEGGKEPYERTRRLIEKLSGQLKLLPYRVSITGHTSATRLPSRPGYGAWELSADRANACGGFSKPRAFRRPACPWWRARPTPSRCFPTIPSSRRTAGSPSR